MRNQQTFTGCFLKNPKILKNKLYFFLCYFTYLNCELQPTRQQDCQTQNHSKCLNKHLLSLIAGQAATLSLILTTATSSKNLNTLVFK